MTSGTANRTGRPTARPWGSTPHRPPGFPLPEDCWDGPNHLVYRAETGTGGEFVRVDLRTGKGEPLPKAKEADAGTFAGRQQIVRRLLPAGNAFLKDRLLGES